MSAYPPEIIYRELKIDDFHSLREIGHQCLPLPYPDTYWLRIASDANNYYSLGAFNKQQKLVGVIGVIRYANNYFAGRVLNPDERRLIDSYRKVCYITTLMVAPDYRKNGIATQLLQRASTVLLQEGRHLIYLHVLHSNVPAIQLYEKMGYEKVTVVPDYYTIDGQKQPGVVYCRRLVAPMCHDCIANNVGSCTIL